jgi:hypothetical protein
MMVFSIAIALIAGGCKKTDYLSRDTSKIVPPPPEPEEPEEPVDPTLVLFTGADAPENWQTVGEVKISTDGKKEGTGYIPNTIADGSDFMQFIYNAPTPFDTKLTIATGQFSFWWYLSDPSLLKADGQIEINSNGNFDHNEIHWNVADIKPTLKAGWNQVVLKFSNAVVEGGDINLAGVKQFRVFFWTETKSHDPLVTGIDGLTFNQKTAAPAVFLSNVDAATNWQTVGEPKIVAEGKKEGTGFLQNTIADGSDFMQFIYKNTEAPVNTTFTKDGGMFTFWWYLSDPSLLKADGQIEINSNGDFDHNELHWNIADLKPGLKPGWNELKLKFSTAVVEGGDIDLAAIKQFRVFFWTETKSHEPLVSGVDALRFIEAQ